MRVDRAQVLAGESDELGANLRARRRLGSAPVLGTASQTARWRRRMIRGAKLGNSIFSGATVYMVGGNTL